jgi:hypothetical protein
VSEGPVLQLSREQVLALKFAAHRQLARWAKTRPLQPRQHARRTALVHAVRSLEHNAFADGCELRAPATSSSGD